MHCAYITTIHELRKHSNADRLQCATVFGNNVIVDLSYKVGDRVIYFPVDGQVSAEFAADNDLLRRKDKNGNPAGGYLDPDKRNIKALKIRGEKSEGLILPISVLSKYVNVQSLKDGDKISVLNGHEICRKYIPNQNQNSSRTKTKEKAYQNKKVRQEPVFTYEYFKQHAETEQLAYNQDAFRPGDICVITLKIHGTSQRTANTLATHMVYPGKIAKLFGAKPKEVKEYKVVSGTRRVVSKREDGGFSGDNMFRQKYHDFFASKLPKGMEVFYEVAGYLENGTPIMKKCQNSRIKDKAFTKQYGPETVFSYGCEPGENDCYVYRMTMTNEDGFVVELPWHQVQMECEKMGVKCVPTFERFIYTTWDDLMRRVEQYYDGPDPIGKTHIREGVVVRIENRGTFTAFKHKNFSFKVLESIIKDESDAPDIEEAQELISEETEQ